MLIAAMWLLLLAGSIAALLMLRGLDAARDVRQTQADTAAQWIADDAVATIVAGILFRGQTSGWAQLPSTGSIPFDGRSVAASLAAEDDRLDVNKAPLALIDDTLHDHGFPPEQRSPILARIAANRAGARPLASIAAVAALASGVLPAGQESCLAESLSPFGGTTRQGLSVDTRAVRLGDVLRLRVRGAQGEQVILFRLIGNGTEPYAILDSFRATCRSAPSGGAA